jgi:D-cysteine desulfhydrase family pyridoxal phosphate-dependent enzyme
MIAPGDPMLDDVERIPLAFLPTPLDPAVRLGKHLGVSRLLIKRDDLTGLAMGGNKARKLEYDFAEILQQGYDVVLTVGGVQSNHARMTAAAARRLGLDVKLVLGGPDIAEYQGNLLLNTLLGAEVRFLRNNDRNEDLEAAMHEWSQELQQGGAKPYCIPIGGSTGLGALGYVRAMRELADQLDGEPVQIVLAVGSCGTLAGTVLGARLFLPGSRVVGISVSRTASAIKEKTVEIMNQSMKLLHLPDSPSDLEVEAYDSYFDEYGVVTPGGLEAIRLAARLEGLILDPVYTGKALAGLIDLVEDNVLDRSMPIVFIHTGGLPILFAYEKTFSPWASFTMM